MHNSISIDNVVYKYFELKDIEETLKTNFKEFEIIYYNEKTGCDLCKYKDIFFVFDILSYCHIRLMYNENDKQKLMPLINKLTKLQFFSTTKSFIIDKKVEKTLEFHRFNTDMKFNYYTLICTGFKEKERYK